MLTKPLQIVGLAALVAAVPLGLVWAATPTSTHEEAIRVHTEADTYRHGDVVRAWIRNAGSDDVTGAPTLLVLDERGSLHRTFPFQDVQLTLEPGEPVWVDWETQPRHYPCGAGAAEMGDAAARSVAPCGPVAQSDPSCYGCWHQEANQRLVLVGVFGGEADAATIMLRGSN